MSLKTSFLINDPTLLPTKYIYGQANVSKIITLTHPIVFVIVVIVGPPCDEQEDHGENHEDDEDGAGVDVNGKDCQSIQIAGYCIKCIDLILVTQ